MEPIEQLFERQFAGLDPKDLDVAQSYCNMAAQARALHDALGGTAGKGLDLGLKMTRRYSHMEQVWERTRDQVIKAYLDRVDKEESRKDSLLETKGQLDTARLAAATYPGDTYYSSLVETYLGHLEYLESADSIT